jgi:SAM-dependent MidA family methyltransferase
VNDRASAPLALRLRERIEREGGAISFHDWMEAALYDERDGYYRHADMRPWGREGDYRTSPERSPLFAATFARFFARLYEELGKPASWIILEAGAGAGQFAQTCLETLSLAYPQTFSATRYVIDETSATAAALARERLAHFGARVEFRSPYESIAPWDAGIVFANELLDAFPAHRVTFRDGRLLELYVGVGDDGEFCWIEGRPSTPRLSQYLERLNMKLADGQTAEINLRAVDWLERIASLFKRGYLILVDYGAEAQALYDARIRPRGSLRAFHRHRLVRDVLGEPGRQDITTTVDWTTVKRACREAGLEIVSFERQERFLLDAGLQAELERMTAQVESEAVALILRASVRELILPGGMSESFQVLVAARQSAG